MPFYIIKIKNKAKAGSLLIEICQYIQGFLEFINHTKFVCVNVIF